jgi:hypothetical protein
MSMQKVSAVLQEAMPSLKAGSVALLTTTVCIYGEDTSGYLPRTPVKVRIAMSPRLPNITDIRVFSPPLALQRYELVREVRLLL